MNKALDSVWFHARDGTGIRAVQNPDIVPEDGDIVRLMEEDANATGFTKYRVVNTEYMISDRIQAQVMVEPVDGTEVEL